MIQELLRQRAAQRKQVNDTSVNGNNNTTMTEKIKRKRELLMNYALNPNSTSEDFDKIIAEYGDDVPFSVNEAMDLIQSINLIFPQINSIMNNFDNFYNKNMGAYLLKYAKEHNLYNQTFTRVNRFKNNPYFSENVSNKEFKEIWKSLKNKYSFLNDSDLDITHQLYNIEDLKQLIGYSNDVVKEKTTEEYNIPSLDLSIPTTKGELYRYWNNLSELYNPSNINVFGDITTNCMNDKLDDIKVCYVIYKPKDEDFQNRILLSNDKHFQDFIQFLPEKDRIAINICNSTKSNSTIGKICLSKIFDKILLTLSKNCILVPVDAATCQLFGCTDFSQFYKYNKHIVVCNMAESYNDAMNVINDIVINNQKVSVKRVNNFNTENVIVNIENHINKDGLYYIDKTLTNSNNNVDNNVNNNIDNKIANITLDQLNSQSDFQFSQKIYTFSEFERILNELDGYNIAYISKSLSKGNSGIDKNGKSYIVMRKGLDKRFYYLDPSITLGYSVLKDAKVEEPLNRLNIVNNVPLSKIYHIKYNIKQEEGKKGVIPYFYNSDFTNSTYIASHIRNRYKYKEGSNNLRIVVLDFETEMDAIKVKGNTPTTDAKCRLISLFDILTKTFYCAVLKDLNYHKDITINDIKEHDGCKVYIDEYTNEVDLWKWLNKKIYELDPDIITGWNVEKFDLTYAIVRSTRTLNIPFKSKYGNFEIITNRGNGEFSVGVDGIVILDYQSLYRICKPNKMESYKLEFICQEELKKGKRPLIVDDHDKMYYEHLREYVLYNLEDVERVYELENKMNYIKFQYEMCNVCNVSWDDIYSKTRLVDGLVYNYAWDNYRTLLKERTHEEDVSHNINSILFSAISEYMTNNNISTIANGKISLNDQLNKLTNLSSNKDDDNEGYEGAVVLEPQKGIYDIVADLDASQMYPRLMIRCNIFKDTLCGIILINNEENAEKWMYNRDEFPSEILIKEFNKANNQILKLSKAEFEDYLKDKILTPFGTIYWKASVKRSLISNTIIMLINNRIKYKNLMKECIGKIDILKKDTENHDKEILELTLLVERYDNLQTAYKYLINSFYGVMGMFIYRLADIFSAATITACGRELTKMVCYYSSMYIDKMMENKKIDVNFNEISIDCKTLKDMEMIENRPNVLYGDTDSEFVWMGKVIRHIYGDNISTDQKIEYAWQAIDRVSKFINEYVIINILKRKGIDPNDEDKDYNYEYKKEIVMSKILFGEAKKQYAMHMVMREGKKLDKVDIKGMPAIKSDNTRFSRNLGMDIINYLLKDYDIQDKRNSNKILIEKYKNSIIEASELINVGDLSIGRPVSMVKDISSYATIQAGIRGMLLYDVLFDHEFRAGSKGYQYYISKINWEKLHTTPTDIKMKFMQKYGTCKWYNKVMSTCTDELFFSSITIPVDLTKLDTSLFIINKKETITTCVKEKIADLMNLVGIRSLDETDNKKLLRKTFTSQGMMEIKNMIKRKDPNFTI